MNTSQDTFLMNARNAFHHFVEDELGFVFANAMGENLTSEAVFSNSYEENLAIFQKIQEALVASFLIFLEKEDLATRFSGNVGELFIDLFSVEDAATRAAATDALFDLFEIH